MRSCRCCAGCMAASPACRTWTFWSARLRYCAGFQIQRACIVAVIMSRVYISATLAPTSVLLLGCSTAGAPCLQASCHPPAPHWLRHVSTDQAMLLFKLLTKRVCDLILFSMQVLPGGAAPTARAAAVGALLDELAAAWRRYQHTLDCKRKAAQLSCVPRFRTRSTLFTCAGRRKVAGISSRREQELRSWWQCVTWRSHALRLLLLCCLPMGMHKCCSGCQALTTDTWSARARRTGKAALDSSALHEDAGMAAPLQHTRTEAFEHATSHI